MLMYANSCSKAAATYALLCSGMLTYAHVCSRMLTYAHICSLFGAGRGRQSVRKRDAHVCSRMLTYAHVCSRMQGATKCTGPSPYTFLFIIYLFFCGRGQESVRVPHRKSCAESRSLWQPLLSGVCVCVCGLCLCLCLCLCLVYVVVYLGAFGNHSSQVYIYMYVCVCVYVYKVVISAPLAIFLSWQSSLRSTLGTSLALLVQKCQGQGPPAGGASV